MIYDLSQSYQIAFYVAGACSTVATCLLFLVPALMPQDTCDDERGRAETVHSGTSDKPLLDGIRSPDSSIPTTSTKASLGSCQELNSNMRLAPSQSYLDRYWGMPKRASMRASMASLLSFAPLQPAREVLVVVEKVSQVWENGRRFDFKRHRGTSLQYILTLKKADYFNLRVPSYTTSSRSSWFNTFERTILDTHKGIGTLLCHGSGDTQHR